MAFKKYTAKMTFTNKVPKQHLKYYTDFPLYAKKENNENVIDNEKMYEYFNEPFSNEAIKINVDVKGDDLDITEFDLFSAKIKRSFFENYDIKYFNYVLVEIFWDENSSEKFYCWIIRKNLIYNDLSFMNFSFIVDYFPTFYEQIKEQYMLVVIDRRSFPIYKSKDSIQDELKRRLERKSWNISCDELCQADDILYYSHHFKSLNKVHGKYIYHEKLKQVPNYLSSPNYGILTSNNTAICDKPPCSVNISPLFKINIGSRVISENPNAIFPAKTFEFDNFEVSYKRWLNMNDDKILKDIKQLIKDSEIGDFVLIFLYEYNNLGSENNFKLSIREYPNEENKYDDFKFHIPLHFQQFHTEYVVRANQDEINQIQTELIFLSGYNKKEKNFWKDDINLNIAFRTSADDIFYDVYYDNNYENKKNEFVQNTINPLISFNTWMKIFYKGDDWENYLRSNKERRKIARASQNKDFLVGATSKILGGSIAGGIAAAKYGATIGSYFGLNPISIGTGVLVGATIGFATFFGKSLIDEYVGTSERAQMEAREKDLMNSSSPPIPSNVGGDYISIFANKKEENELQIMHPLGVYVTEMVAFGWEWKNEFESFDKLGVASQKLLDNLIKFGEKCFKTIDNFNLFEFILKNKTDQNVFYIHMASAIPKNFVFYSNIFSILESGLSETLMTGLRFHIYGI